jgi:hypothetical protein
VTVEARTLYIVNDLVVERSVSVWFSVPKSLVEIACYKTNCSINPTMVLSHDMEDACLIHDHTAGGVGIQGFEMHSMTCDLIWSGSSHSAMLARVLEDGLLG